MHQEQQIVDFNDEEYFGEKPLRWYQVAARRQIEEIIETHTNPRIMLVLPTGSGKTLTNGTILMSPRIRQALAKPNKPLRVLFIAHKHRLLTQAEQAYASESGIRTITSLE